MIIANTTPLINFSAIRRLDILEQLFGKIHIPSAVENELLVKGKHYPTATEIKNAMFIQVIEIKNITLANSLEMNIDKGEAEAITLALEKEAHLLLLDEITARTTAEFYNISFTGTIGCLVEAKKTGIIHTIKPFLDKMRTEARFWINLNLYHKILRDNDEL